jgi:putative spermidine/putrescine transport system permease protein
MLIQSFGVMHGIGIDGLTLNYYADVLDSEMFYSSVGFSIILSAIASLFSVGLGFGIAFMLSEEKEEGRIMSILRLPLLLPHFTAAFLVFLLFSQSGLASRVMENLGLITSIEEFPELIFDTHGLGISISYIWKEVPFCILFILPTLKLISKGLGEAASTLGASKLQYLLQVALPTCKPSMVSLFIILFAYNFGSFEVPFILGASYPKAVGVLGYISYVSADLSSRPFTMALNIIITIMGAMLILAYISLVRKIKSMEGQL